MTLNKLLYILHKFKSQPFKTMGKGFYVMKSYWTSLIRAIFNRPKELVGITIPIYKESLDENETISLKQCLRILGNKYSIIFITPVSLKTDYYQEFCKGYQNISFEYFDDYYFKNLDEYSTLMTTIKLYERFYKYKFILIHQLDVFVFRDDLEYWCNKNYDYIGSPWLGRNTHNNPDMRLGLPFWVSSPACRKLFKEKDRSVGNGGFSLRKVKSVSLALLIFKGYLNRWRHYEDTFFSIAVPNLNPFFKIPNKEIALKFGVELEPKKAYQILNEILPFGCHAWEKRDFDFWKPIIESYGYKFHH